MKFTKTGYCIYEWFVDSYSYPASDWAVELNRLSTEGWEIFDTEIDSDPDDGGLIIVARRPL